jgi:hypothetical protein
MMRRGLVVALFLVAVHPLYAGFNEVVRAVEVRTGLHRKFMPGLGLLRFAVWCVHPEGVRDFQMAMFEERAGSFDPRDLGAVLASAAGEGYRPLVQAHSRREGEWTFIYAKPVDDEHIDLLIATRDNSDTVVLRAVIDPDRMLAHIGEPHGVVKLAKR